MEEQTNKPVEDTGNENENLDSLMLDDFTYETNLTGK